MWSARQSNLNKSALEKWKLSFFHYFLLHVLHVAVHFLSLHSNVIIWGFICCLSACLQCKKMSFPSAYELLQYPLLRKWQQTTAYVRQYNIFSFWAWWGFIPSRKAKVQLKSQVIGVTVKVHAFFWFCWIKSNVTRFMTQVQVMCLESTPLLQHVWLQIQCRCFVSEGKPHHHQDLCGFIFTENPQLCTPAAELWPWAKCHFARAMLELWISQQELPAECKCGLVCMAGSWYC